MARMVSPAGEMEVNVQRLSISQNQLVITGQIGIWDSDIYFQPEEVLYLVRFMVRLSFLKYILTLPFAYLARKSAKSRENKSQ